jgi:threonine dehydratase
MGQLAFNCYENSNSVTEGVKNITFEKIEQAAKQLEPVIQRTPTILSPWLSHHINGEVYLKLENLQVTGSFKPRGTFICMDSLTSKEKSHGVITMSAGNHAQAVAYTAQQMGISATIVMPENTPIAKVERSRIYGASIVLHGETILDARDFALQLMKKNNYALIHPFDDPNIIIGHGSVGIEMLNDVKNLDVLLIPIGGGALASGIGIVAKKLNPSIQIIGIQSLYSPSTAKILFPNAVQIDTRTEAQTIAEGIAIKAPGHFNLAILRDVLDDMLIVNEIMIENAMEALIINSKIVAEGAGAAGVAAIIARKEIFMGKRVGTVVCGGNVDSRILSNLLMRGLVHEGRLVRLKIEVSDNPGMLGHLSQIIGKAGGNIFEISHQRLFNKTMIKIAYVDAVIETRDVNHAQLICKTLIDAGYQTKIMEDSL